MTSPFSCYFCLGNIFSQQQNFIVNIVRRIHFCVSHINHEIPDERKTNRKCLSWKDIFTGQLIQNIPFRSHNVYETHSFVVSLLFLN